MTSPENPLTGATVTANVAVPPAAAVTDEGDAASVKAGGAGTTSVSGTACATAPLVPVIVERVRAGRERSGRSSP